MHILDAKTILGPGIQGWKCPGSLAQTWYGSKSLEFNQSNLISNFGVILSSVSPVLTLRVSPPFTKIFEGKNIYLFEKSKLVENLVRAHTTLVLRESLDDALHHLLPWDIELLIDEPVDEPARRGTRSLSVDCIYSYLLNLLSVETRVWSYNLYITLPFLSSPSQLTLMKRKTVPKVCVQRKREKD
jgi:hypothetical protein